MKRSILVAGFVAFVFAMISEVWSGSFSALISYFASSTSAQTKGVIIRSDLEKKWSGGHIVYEYNIEYEYMVEGIKYTSHRVEHNIKTMNAAEKVKAYPVGKRVDVYYDPDKPYYSVLDDGGIGRGVFVHLSLIGIVFCFILFVEIVARYYPDSFLSKILGMK